MILYKEIFQISLSELRYGFFQEEIIGSAYVTAQYIKHVLNYSGKVYLIGSMGLKQELDIAGIPNIGFGVS